MAVPFVPSPIDRWRTLAALLRRTATEVSEPVEALSAFARDDVWLGGIARSFATDLDLHRRRLTGTTAPALEDLAARLEAMATVELQRIDAARPAPDADPRLEFLRRVANHPG